MEKSAPYFIVGLFVTLAVFGVVGFLIWLQGPRDHQNLAFYTVEFTDPVTGLQEGSDVQYRGVKVGKVKKIHLVPGSNSLVQADIGVDKKTPVRAHTRVVLQTQGITGLVQMEMETADNDLSPPPRVAGMEYPVLQGQGSLFYKALDDLPVITAQTRDITKKVNGALDSRIITAMRSAVVNTNTLSHEVENTTTVARKLVDKLNADPSQILYQPSTYGVEIPK